MKNRETIQKILDEAKRDLKKGESKEIFVNGNKVIIENLSDYSREKYKKQIQELNN